VSLSNKVWFNPSKALKPKLIYWAISERTVSAAYLEISVLHKLEIAFIASLLVGSNLYSAAYSAVIIPTFSKALILFATDWYSEINCS